MRQYIDHLTTSYFRINDVQDESIGFLVTLVSAITDIIGNLEDIDNYIVTIVAEVLKFVDFDMLFGIDY